MTPLVRILIGLGFSLLGLVMVWKTIWVIGIMGRNAWAEKIFGPGGSPTFYKYVGVLIIIIGFVIATDLFGFFFGGIINRLFGGL